MILALQLCCHLYGIDNREWRQQQQQLQLQLHCIEICIVAATAAVAVATAAPSSRVVSVDTVQ